MTISTTCKCGAGIAVPVFAYPLIHAFTQRHEYCIAPNGDELEEPGGDVYASAERSAPHTEPELVTGFQRNVDWG